MFAVCEGVVNCDGGLFILKKQIKLDIKSMAECKRPGFLLDLQPILVVVVD